MGLKVIWGTQLTVKVDELARTYQTLKQLFIVSIWLDIQIYILSSNLFYPNFPFSELGLWSNV